MGGDLTRGVVLCTGLAHVFHRSNSSWTARFWRWRHYVPLKQQLFTRRYGVTFRKTRNYTSRYWRCLSNYTWQPNVCCVVTPNTGSALSSFGLITRPTISSMIVSTGMYITRCIAVYCLRLTQHFSCNRQSVLEPWYGKLKFSSWFVGHIYFIVTTTDYRHERDGLWACW